MQFTFTVLSYTIDQLHMFKLYLVPLPAYTHVHIHFLQVVGLTEHPVTNVEAVWKLIKTGNATR